MALATPTKRCLATHLVILLQVNRRQLIPITSHGVTSRNQRGINMKHKQTRIQHTEIQVFQRNELQINLWLSVYRLELK